MSDEKLRELERTFRDTESEDAELAWLRERARAGEELDWETYLRLHELDVAAAASYLRWRVDGGSLSQEAADLTRLLLEGGRRKSGSPTDLTSEFAARLTIASLELLASSDSEVREADVAVPFIRAWLGLAAEKRRQVAWWRVNRDPAVRVGRDQAEPRARDSFGPDHEVERALAATEQLLSRQSSPTAAKRLISAALLPWLLAWKSR